MRFVDFASIFYFKNLLCFRCREQSNGNYAEELKLKENKSDEHVCVGVKKAVDTTNTNVNLKVNECDPPRRHSSLLISRL